ncbi:hypothetical protein [Rummeliibacillus sp. SL167]|uniref:hypothetical protein n=1 Tax=Rummeliibacillus sp. SL167 TaxID=2579792 RepID=UPI0016485321|nr:hypothetical protein [Rummeliibacillus sp. SL167]
MKKTLTKILLSSMLYFTFFNLATQLNNTDQQVTTTTSEFNLNASSLPDLPSEH